MWPTEATFLRRFRLSVSLWTWLNPFGWAVLLRHGWGETKALSRWDDGLPSPGSWIQQSRYRLPFDGWVSDGVARLRLPHEAQERRQLPQRAQTLAERRQLAGVEAEGVWARHGALLHCKAAEGPGAGWGTGAFAGAFAGTAHAPAPLSVSSPSARPHAADDRRGCPVLPWNCPHDDGQPLPLPGSAWWRTDTWASGQRWPRSGRSVRRCAPRAEVP